MNIDDLLCLCCIIFLILYILENTKFNHVYQNLIVAKNNSNKYKKQCTIKKFFNNHSNNNNYNLYFPNKSSQVKVTNREIVYFSDFLINIIKSLCYKLNLDTNSDFKQVESPNTIVSNYNDIYQLWTTSYLDSKKYKLKIKLVIIYVSKKEYYIVDLSLLHLIKKQPSSKFRKSKFYNKWII